MHVANRQLGFSLIELLVSMALTSIIMVAIGSVYRDSAGLYMRQITLSNVTNDAGFFQDVVLRDVAHSGFSEVSGFLDSALVFDVSIDGGATQTLTQDDVVTNGVVNDTIGTVYRADLQGSYAYDCQGNRVDSSIAVWPSGRLPKEVYVINYYYIGYANAADMLGSLSCTSYIAPSVNGTNNSMYDASKLVTFSAESALISNVVSLHFLYGVDLSARNASPLAEYASTPNQYDNRVDVNQYMTANQVKGVLSNIDSNNPGESQKVLGELYNTVVRNVNVSLVLSTSRSQNTGATVNREVDMLDKTRTVTTDKIFYTVNQKIDLRNSVGQLRRGV